MTNPLQVPPWDEFNQALVANVHPADWRNPKPTGRYNLVVIGAGSAGLVTAAGAAGLGAKVALIERDFLGGDCLNVGCVPSKALLRAARARADVARAAEFGVVAPGDIHVDFPAVMERLRRLRAEISPNDSAARFRSLGVDVYLGSARFTGPDCVEVAGERLHFHRAVIATGARATRPPIPGLEEAGFYTNESIFNITQLPRRLAILGAGPIGCELAQAFARFGSQVTLIADKDRILPREDPEAAAVVRAALTRDGIDIRLRCQVQSVRADGQDKTLVAVIDGKETHIIADAILVGVGRTPNVDGLGLDVAGVAFDVKEGVRVDDRLRTTNPRIYAAGDISSRFKFTHAADAMARIVIQNALFLGRARASALVIPWCTYTDPEIAHVGRAADEEGALGRPEHTVHVSLRDVDRARLDGETDGFVKLHIAGWHSPLLGATIVGRHAGDMIAQISMAVAGGLTVADIAKTVFPYPTQAEAIKKAADSYNRTRLTPFVKRLFEKWLRWRRG